MQLFRPRNVVVWVLVNVRISRFMKRLLCHPLSPLPLFNSRVSRCTYCVLKIIIKVFGSTTTVVVHALRLPGSTFRKRAGRSLIKISFTKLRIRKLSQVWSDINRSCVHRERRDSIEFVRFPIKMPSRVKRRHNSI